MSQIYMEYSKIQAKKTMKTITLYLKIDKEQKGLTVFKKEFEEKYKDKIKIIYDNKIFDLKSVLPIWRYTYSIKVKLLLLSDIFYIGEILKDLKAPLFYLRNDNIVPPLIYDKFPKLVYNTDDSDIEESIKIFDDSFVDSYSHTMILYKDIMFPIQSSIEDYDKSDEKLEIYLVMLDKPRDLMKMFYQCSKLEEISINEEDNSINPEDKRKDLTNIIHEVNTSNNIGDNGTNTRTWLKDIEKSDDLTVSALSLGEFNLANNHTVKYLLEELNTSLAKTKVSYFKDIPSLIEKSNICKWKPSLAFSMFHDCSLLRTIPDISNWNTEDLVSIYSMFYNCKKLTSIPDISKWNFPRKLGLEFHHLFYNCSSLQSIPDISNWDTTNTTSFSGVFYGCSSLESIPDISKWKTNINNDFSSMFEKCTSLISLPDLSKWNTRLVKDMHRMFCECSYLISLPDISKWNTQSLEDISTLFCGCSSLDSLPDISKWETFKLKKMSLLFRECTSLKSIPDISKWFVSYVEDFSSLFYNCIALLSLPDLSKWDTGLVTSIKELFNGCSSLVSLPDISQWHLYQIKNMKDLFANCSSLISLPDISNWITFEVEDISAMFFKCSSLISVPNMSHWIVDNVKDMSLMFYECSSLVSIPDISNWKTSNVTNLHHMFYQCSSLISIPDISKWKIDNVSFMSDMFHGCTSLISLPNIDKWLYTVIINRIRIYDIFEDCSSLLYTPTLNKYSKELWLSNDKNDNRQYSRFDGIHKVLY